MTRSQLLLGMIIGSFACAAVSLGACTDEPSGDGRGPVRTDGTSGGEGTSGGTSGTPGPAPVTYRAKATIAPTEPVEDGGTPLSGTVEFAETDGTTKVTIRITGGVPGDHGIHIHENPSCDDAGAGAGGHWNPADAGHGFPDSPTHHLGDLGNVTVNADGTGSTVKTSTEFHVKDGPTSVVNRAVIYHAQHDDGLPPAGNAGGRPGCGVIVKE